MAGQSFAEERDALIRHVGERLLIEPNADIRIYLIDILASVIEEAPEAKAYLTERVRRESHQGGQAHWRSHGAGKQCKLMT